MPLQFRTGIINGDLHTRSATGLFDILHMGQLELRGTDVATIFETLVPGDICGLGNCATRYTQLTNCRARIMDDLMATMYGDSLFLVVNAANTERDIAHIKTMISNCVELI